MPPVRSVGVRYQRAPSNRSPRALATPAVSAPASGWPPTKRSAPSRAASPATSSRLVEPTSVIAVSAPAAPTAAATRSGRARTGAAQKASSAPSSARATESAARSSAPRSSACARLARSGSKPMTSASSRLLAASPIEPPIRPTPRTASLIRGCVDWESVGVRVGNQPSRLHRAGEPVEDHGRSLPIEAGVRDRLPVDEPASGVEVLAAGDDERFEHDPDDRAVPGGDLLGDPLGSGHLSVWILGAVAVRRVDHESLGHVGGAEQLDGPRDVGGRVVRPVVAAAEDHVAVGITGRVEDRRRPRVVDAGERVWDGGGADGVDGDLHVAIGSVLEPDRHREAGAELAVRLALARPGTDRPPGDGVGDVLRGDRIEELAADEEAEVEDREEELAGGSQARVDVAGAVEVSVVDEPLPAHGRPRLLEVDPHRDQQVLVEFAGRGGEATGVVERGLGVVDAARARDDEQAIIVAV